MQETPKEKDKSMYAGRDIDWLIANISNPNIAKDLEETELTELGSRVYEDYDIDKASRKGWEDVNEKAMNLAKQVSSGRTYAGETIADVMYPIIATAAIQYSSRALSAIMKSDEVVKHRVVGYDPDGAKAARGCRVSNHMNYQILEQMDDWDGNMDKLLVSHSIVGCYFKKIHYDTTERQNRSDLISPDDLIVNYWAKSLEDAQQKTHRLEYTHNEYLEFVAAETWLDIDLVKPEDKDKKVHEFLEQHRCYDLDGDGYDEPYIVTIHKDTKKVVRVTTCYEETGIVIHTNGEIIKIKPKQYFVEYGFMPSFDGSFYKIGFGALLSPINESVNTIINQLLDAGTRANRQCGFIGKGVRILQGGESGVIRFKSGEWKQVQSLGTDLRNNVFPLPVGEPSNVLFQLLGLLLEASKELSSRSDLLSGNQQQHNVPATTTLALIEQGLQVFGGIYKRVFKGLKKELKMLYELNRDNLTEEEYMAVVDDPKANILDYRTEGYDIIPISTNSTMTETQKYVKAQAMREWYGQPGINSEKIARFYFESLEIPDAPEYIAPPPQGPTPEQQIEMEKMRQGDMRLRLDAQRLEMEMEMNKHRQTEIHSKVIKNIADAESKEVGVQIDLYEQEAQKFQQQLELLNNRIENLRKLKEQKMAEEQAAAQAKQNAAQAAPQGEAM